MNLVIDVGNTRVKAAVFKQDTQVNLNIFDVKNLVSEIKKISNVYAVRKAIIANVASISAKEISSLEQNLTLIHLTSTTKIPFKNLYKTPKTLGKDRIALVSRAVKKFPHKNVLIIDAGTCITYDFVNHKSEYLGGAISPGVTMRYKALHHYTSKLPELTQVTPKNFIGNSTEESIHSGVINGVINEIEGLIEQYKKKYLHLTVVLTGGDTIFLSKQLKSSIFAIQNFLLEGLNEILIFNENR